jgi:hypothetical protein
VYSGMTLSLSKATKSGTSTFFSQAHPSPLDDVLWRLKGQSSWDRERTDRNPGKYQRIEITLEYSAEDLRDQNAFKSLFGFQPQDVGFWTGHCASNTVFIDLYD